EQFFETCFVYPALCCQYPVAIHFPQPTRLHEIVDRRIGWPRVECNKHIPAIPPGDVTHPTEIEYRCIAAGIDTAQQGSMIYGGERSPLPASTHICCAEVIGDLGPQQFAHQPSITELPRVSSSPSLRRPMQNSLSMEADDTDISHRKPAFLHQFAHSSRLRARQ